MNKSRGSSAERLAADNDKELFRLVSYYRLDVKRDITEKVLGTTTGEKKEAKDDLWNESGKTVFKRKKQKKKEMDSERDNGSRQKI